jgi:Ca2+-binding EF-hand superfamily protein
MSSKRASEVRRRPSEAVVFGAATTFASRNRRWAKMFNQLDTSGDGVLDKQEFLAAIASWTESCPRLQEQEELDDFSSWDCDGSESLCEGEFFCFCDALLQILGEREFLKMEASIKVHVEVKRSVTGTTLKSEMSEGEIRELSREPTADGMLKQATDRLRLTMQTAETTDSRKVLRKEINQARSAGVDRQMIDDALDLVRKLEAEELLERSMESGKPKILKAALLNASKCKSACDKALVTKAEELLATIEAQESLASAIATKDPFIVEAAIAKAKRAKISTDEIAKAQAEADRLEEIRQARAKSQERVADAERQVQQAAAKSKELQAELTSILAKKELAHLNKFIDQLERENVQDPILEKARRAVPEMQVALQARKVLSKHLFDAGSDMNLKEFQDAINKARVVGLPDEEIARATIVLKKEQAREALTNAIAVEKRSKLVKAIDAATELRLTLPELETAKRLLKKLDVSRDLSAVLAKPDEKYDVKTLRNLVAEAVSLGVDAGKVDKVEELIANIPPDDEEDGLECDEDDGLT